MQPQPPFPGLGLIGFKTLQQQHIRLYRPFLHPPAAAVGTGKVQHILNEPPHAVPFPGDDLRKGLLFRTLCPLHGGSS